jgi:hypothetical protein
VSEVWTVTGYRAGGILLIELPTESGLIADRRVTEQIVARGHDSVTTASRWSTATVSGLPEVAALARTVAGT